MNEQENTLSYALTPNLGCSAKSVTVKRYSAQMKSSGTFGDAELKSSNLVEVVLAGEEPDTYRFTASRKVTVR